MKTLNVSFVFNRHGDVKTESINLPDTVPFHGYKMAIRAKLRSTHDFVGDIVIHENNTTIFTHVECSLPNGYETFATGY